MIVPKSTHIVHAPRSHADVTMQEPKHILLRLGGHTWHRHSTHIKIFFCFGMYRNVAHHNTYSKCIYQKKKKSCDCTLVPLVSQALSLWIRTLGPFGMLVRHNFDFECVLIVQFLFECFYFGWKLFTYW